MRKVRKSSQESDRKTKNSVLILVVCFPKGLLLQVSIDFERVEMFPNYIFSKIGTDLNFKISRKNMLKRFFARWNN